MKLKQISFYKNFKCLAQNCPDTCCRGWIIPLDDDAIELYHSQKGLLLLRLLMAEKTQNGTICFNKNSSTCSFLTKEGLCYLEKQFGEKFLCDTCREYPRLHYNYKYMAKECLDLSCPQAAKLFIKSIGHIDYITQDTVIDYYPTVTNDDETYFNSLVNLEDRYLNHIDNTSLNIDIIFNDLYNYSKLIQESYISNPDTTILNEDYSFSSDKGFHFNALSADRIIHTKFYHGRLKKTDPELYRLCSLYKKKFNKLTIREADILIDNASNVIKKVYPEIDTLLRSYCKYSLICSFMAIYEDYSFLKHTSMPIIHTYMIRLFLYLHIDNSNSLTEDELIKILTAYDRRAKHNVQIISEMYDEIYKAMDNS